MRRFDTMNPVAEEILSYLGTAEKGDALEHYGIARRSGRYPWGSGDDPYQHGSVDFLTRVEALKKNGWTETAENIKKEFGEHVTLEDYRNEKSWCNYERRLRNVETAKALVKDGKNTSEIGRIMGVNESTVRLWLDPKKESRMKEAANTAEFLKKEVDENGMVDVGAGLEIGLKISRTRLDQALYKLKGDGYELHGGRIDQVTNPSQKTTQLVLCPPGTPHSAIYDLSKIHTIKDFISRDDGKTFEKKFTYPESLDSKRLMIRYKEDGGIEKDGIVELRRGVPDLSLGESRYSQVRIMVDGKKYIKGMAVYGDDKSFPPGVDVIFNTNKSKSVPKMDVLKDIKNDPDNPFGSLIKDADQGGQYWYTDKKTGEKKLGLINKRSDEGDWNEWKDTLPAQFLSKQPISLAKKQLDIAKADKLVEYDEICSLNNPTIKKHLLQKFADNCDAAAVSLKAAALPGQKYHVMIAFPTMKDTEVYAPGYKEGTKLALVRYPHGGTFEIPILTVNNKHQTARQLLGTDSVDVVGVNSKVAERLSGADFDGDTVMCIPTHDSKGKVRIASRDPLKDLEGFDPKMEYPETPGMKYMKDPKTGRDNTQREMGVISNLINDMTLAGADDDKMARAVKHSMVVIDAGKHKLDYKRSEIENRISELKKEYQPKYDEEGNVVGYGGASTLISRSSGEATVYKRQGSPKINIKGKPYYDPNRPEGALIYKVADDLYYPVQKKDKTTGIVTIRTIDGKKVSYNSLNKDEAELYAPVKRVDPKTGDVIYTNKDGGIVYKTKPRTQPSINMAETDDAYTLVSRARHPMELVYADYANSMKSLANKARIEMVNTGKIKYDSNAKRIYQKEVDSLMNKLNTAELNKIREREANRRANVEVDAKKMADPNMKSEDLRKVRQRAITKYRQEVGSVSRKDRSIVIDDREWEAIQAGAISETQLKKILNNTDIDSLRERATPRATKTLSKAQVNRIKALSATHTLSQIADKLNISSTTVSKYLKGVN